MNMDCGGLLQHCGHAVDEVDAGHTGHPAWNEKVYRHERAHPSQEKYRHCDRPRYQASVGILNLLSVPGTVSQLNKHEERPGDGSQMAPLNRGEHHVIGDYFSFKQGILS